uniref:Ovule protein n=1 Tax=Haemonchus placei TaxID=6290 RepID=A0A0N4X532_HAEPC
LAVAVLPHDGYLFCANVIKCSQHIPFFSIRRPHLTTEIPIHLWKE